jgi:hypothetical protein
MGWRPLVIAASPEYSMGERVQVWRNAAYAGLKSGILFGLIFGSLSVGIEYLFLPRAVLPTLQAHVVVFAACSAAFGLFMGLFFGLFGNSKTIERQTAIELPQGEIVEYQGSANHFLNREARGGRLYVTHRALIFQPHRMNIQKAPIVISRSEIADAFKCRTLGIVPNGIAVLQRSGTKDKFVVSRRDEWIRRIAA